MRLPFNLHSKVTPSCATAIGVSLLPLVYFFPATRGRLVISPDDGVIFNIPLRVAAANIIRGGYLPLWNPYIFSGMPLFGAAQAGVLFPLNWFYLAFGPAVATNLMMLATYVLAALGAYVYARRSEASVSGAALTSIVWQASGFMIGQIGHTNILHTAALLPWLLWAIDGYGTTGRRSRGVLLAVIVALQVFAGHQQTFSYALLVAAAYAVVMWWAGHSANPVDATGPSQPTRPPRPAYLSSLVLMLIGLALAAVQILPTLELLRNSMRSDASYDFFTSFSLPRRFLWTFFAPYVVGGGDGNLFRAPYVGPAFYAEYVGYVGLGTLALAIVCLALRRDARTRFWAIVVLVGLALALGRYAPFGFYRLIYAVPVLNLFRVPARHLMEVEFALAVLAGRGLTAIAAAPNRARMLRWVLAAGAAVFVLTCLAVTVGRPAAFQLGRSGPVSILRAPELFLPIVVAALSAGGLWLFASRRQARTLTLLFVVVAFDLVLWGQSSGWRTASPKADFELWNTPATVQFLHAQPAGPVSTGSVSDRLLANESERVAGKGAEPYRILTQDQLLDPDKPASAAAPPPASGWTVSLQPDVYMMYGVENAAGYDGFGLARYSRLAGDMKVWGDLTDSARTLGTESREIDLLNVRYLLARSSRVTSGSEQAAPLEFPAATEFYGGQSFAAERLNVPSIVAGEQLSFALPPTEADHIALLTNLAWSQAIPDHTSVAYVRLHSADGKTLKFELRAGDHTSEWAYDRADIRAIIKHQRAPVATSYEVEDAQGKYEAHTYVSSFALPRKTVITGGEIEVARIAAAPQLTLSLSRLTLADGERAFPLRGEWLKKEFAASEAAPAERGDVVRADNADKSDRATPVRWRFVADVGKVAVFENTRLLPRAWLVASELVATEDEEINIIRSGKTPNGEPWNPLEKALVEKSTGIDFGQNRSPDEGRRAAVTRNEPNRIEVKTESAAPSLLVLSENHYPGWRAQVDGQSVEVIRVNYNQRGVALAPGKHLVTFVYRPKSVLIGLVISLLTLVALVVWSRLRGFHWDRGRPARNERDSANNVGTKAILVTDPERAGRPRSQRRG